MPGRKPEGVDRSGGAKSEAKGEGKEGAEAKISRDDHSGLNSARGLEAPSDYDPVETLEEESEGGGEGAAAYEGDDYEPEPPLDTPLVSSY